MIIILLAFTSASLIISLFSHFKLRETRSTLAFTRASLLSLKERLKGESLDFEGFNAGDLLTLQELIDNASALTMITEESADQLEGLDLYWIQESIESLSDMIEEEVLNQLEQAGVEL